MQPHTLRRDDIKALSPADRSMICSIYLHRCLTFEQMYRFYYSKESPKRTYANWHLKEMLEKDFLLEIPYQDEEGENKAYFLAATGIILAKRLFKIPSTVLPEAPDRCSAYNWHSKDLKLSPSKINHQIHLNTFALQFAERMGNGEMSYLDEKFVPCKDIYSMRARPDGKVLLPDQALYLEMDMNTERMKSLKMKWDGYRTFAGTNDFYQESQQYPSSVLFILDNVVRVEQRVKTVLQSLESSCVTDCFTPNFDFYIGTPDEMLDISFQHLIPHKPFPLQEWTNGVLHGRFDFQDIQLPKEAPHAFDFFGKIHGQIYAIDTYDRVRGSVLTKMITANRDGVLLGAAMGQPVRHLVITDQWDLLRRDVGLMKCQGMENNYYACIKDLETKPFREVLFRIDQFGNMKEGSISHG